VMAVDHGAQFFTARDPRFKDQVALWEEEGLCFPWSQGFQTWKEGVLHGADPRWKEARYACREGMSRLGKSLGDGLNVTREFQVSSVFLQDGLWQLHADPLHPMSPVKARALFVSAPIPQAIKLIGSHFTHDQLELIEKTNYGPCIAVMSIYPAGTSPSWHGIQVRDESSPISWMAWDSSRRSMNDPGAVAVIHASPRYSSSLLDASKEGLDLAGIELLRVASQIGGSWMNSPISSIVHRWRYAHPEGPSVPGGFLKAVGAEPLYLIGDGLNGGRVEGAWLSGLRAAEDFLLSLRGC
jgi:renalase